MPFRRCTAQIFHAMIRRLSAVRPMITIRPDADVLTSARMAAGMTSRARRPFPHYHAG